MILTLFRGVTSQLAHFPPPKNDANKGKGIFAGARPDEPVGRREQGQRMVCILKLALPLQEDTLSFRGLQIVLKCSNSPPPPPSLCCRCCFSELGPVPMNFLLSSSSNYFTSLFLSLSPSLTGWQVQACMPQIAVRTK